MRGQDGESLWDEGSKHSYFNCVFQIVANELWGYATDEAPQVDSHISSHETKAVLLHICEVNAEEQEEQRTPPSPKLKICVQICLHSHDFSSVLPQ